MSLPPSLVSGTGRNNHWTVGSDLLPTFEPVELARIACGRAPSGAACTIELVKVPAVLHTLEDLSNEWRLCMPLPAGMVSLDMPEECGPVIAKSSSCSRVSLSARTIPAVAMLCKSGRKNAEGSRCELHCCSVKGDVRRDAL